MSNCLLNFIKRESIPTGLYRVISSKQTLVDISNVQVQLWDYTQRFCKFQKLSTQMSEEQKNQTTY